MTDDVEVWYFMIPVAMVFVGIAIALFFWAVKSDQFEDLDRHGSNILFDDDETAHQDAQNHRAHSINSATKEQDEHSA